MDRVVVVSLPRRHERYHQFCDRLESLDWPFPDPSLYRAVDGSVIGRPSWWVRGPGAWGRLLTWIKLLSECLSDGVNSLLALEDDAIFCDRFGPLTRHLLSSLPAHWDEVMLGGQHLRPPQNIRPAQLEQDDPGMERPSCCIRSHARVMRGAYMERALDHLKALRDHSKRPKMHSDRRLAMLQEDGSNHIYTPQYWLAGQAAGQSDTDTRGRSFPQRFWQSSIGSQGETINAAK